MKGCNFIGIGTITLTPKQKYCFKSLDLHFLLSKHADGRIEAINIEFALVTSDEDYDAAVMRLAQMSAEYVSQTIADERLGFNALCNLAIDSATDELWREYRALKFRLAQHKSASTSAKRMSVKAVGMLTKTRYSAYRTAA